MDLDYNIMDISLQTVHLGQSAVVRPVAELFRGSGGTGYDITPQLSGQLNVLTWEESAFAPHPVAGLQNLIARVFGLTMSELAEYCGITRKTLYNWREEDLATSRKKRGFNKLFALGQAARNWHEAGFPPAGNFLHEPVLRGLALHDFLSAEILDQDAMQFIGARLMMRGHTAGKAGRKKSLLA